MALRLADGLTVDDEKAALEIIAKVGPGGHYLAEKHTRKWLKMERFLPSDVIDRLTEEAEKKQGSKDMISRAREIVDSTLTEHVPEPLPLDIGNNLRNVLKEIMSLYGIKSLPIL
jgi:trimethylamine--corrinoid protein Co-methyltransferase